MSIEILQGRKAKSPPSFDICFSPFSFWASQEQDQCFLAPSMNLVDSLLYFHSVA